MPDTAKQSLLADEAALSEEEGGGGPKASSSTSTSTSGSSPFSTTQCFAALAATFLLYLYASSGGGSSSKAAAPPAVKTGPQFGLSMDTTKRIRSHLDARGSPHSVAFRRARDEIKTKHIREAQSDPNSMFDMSTP